MRREQASWTILGEGTEGSIGVLGWIEFLATMTEWWSFLLILSPMITRILIEASNLVFRRLPSVPDDLRVLPISPAQLAIGTFDWLFLKCGIVLVLASSFFILPSRPMHGDFLFLFGSFFDWEQMHYFFYFVPHHIPHWWSSHRSEVVFSENEVWVLGIGFCMAILLFSFHRTILSWQAEGWRSMKSPLGAGWAMWLGLMICARLMSPPSNGNDSYRSLLLIVLAYSLLVVGSLPATRYRLQESN